MTRLHRTLVAFAVALCAAGPALALAPSGRYTLVPNAVPEASTFGVFDRETGLTWQRQYSSAYYTWSAASHYCVELRLGGFTDWRLPSIRELQSTVDAKVSNPSIDTLFFPGTPPSYFWSSSPVASDASKAWSVLYDNGETLGRAVTSQFQVRCVR